MRLLFDIFYNWRFGALFERIMLIYGLFVMGSYIILSIISFIAVIRYVKRNRFTDYKALLTSPFAPGVSILAPAYNEQESIVENIRSLLSIHYSTFDVIVVNDGSTDQTLAKCIAGFDLVQVPYVIDSKIETKHVRGVYRSRNKAFSNLLVVDKENGGKADALNTGINLSERPYITCIDVDCVLHQDAILKLMKPFADQSIEKVIATGGVVRIANSCIIKNGTVEQVRIPKNLVARFQSLEYIRAFLLGRMAWSYLDGLILISGALGVFNKEIAIAAGGYNHDTVGEDMELVVRMRRYMHEQNLRYKVAFVPDPLCWTEVPETWEAIHKQRNRWTRGTIETMVAHRNMLFNPSYGLVGMVSYPYWLFFEWLAPLFEFTGIILTFFFTLFGLITVKFFLLMLLFVYSFSILFSAQAILVEEITYNQYKRKRDILALLFTSFLELFIFHPRLLLASVHGNIDYLKGNKNWDKLVRKGFSSQPTTT